MIRVETLKTPEALREQAVAWAALLSETRQATFFQSLDWLLAYWRHFGDDQTLFVQKVDDGRSPIGFLPLAVRREPSRVGTVRTLTYPLQDWGTFYGPIGPNPALTLHHGLAALKQSDFRFDLLELRWVGKESIDGDRTPRAMNLAGYTCSESVWNEAFILRPTGSGADWRESLPRKFRHHLRRMEKRADVAGGFRRVTHRPRGGAYGDVDPRWDLYDDCVRVAERSWQADPSRGVTLSTPTTGPFLRDVHAAAAANGAVQMDVVYLQDRPIGFAYAYVWSGSYFGLRNGFDPDFAEHSPGAVATVQSLERAIDAGDVTLDLGPASGAYKSTLGAEGTPVACYTHYATFSAKAQALRAKRWLRPTALGRYDDSPARGKSALSSEASTSDAALVEA